MKTLAAVLRERGLPPPYAQSRPLAIEDAANEKFVSHASAWEIAIKVSIRKLELLVPFEEVFPRAVLANGFGVLPPSFGHYRRLIGLPWHHRDPFDRLIAVQALTEGMAIVSSDAMFDAYGVQRIW